jgi:hypothetical protein
MFHVDSIDDTAEELKVAEDKIYKHATKFIEEYCKKYYTEYNTFGKVYQKIFKEANKTICNKVKTVDVLASELLSSNVSLDDFEEWFKILCEKAADKQLSVNYGRDFIQGILADIKGDDPKHTKFLRSRKIAILQAAYYGKSNVSKSLLQTRDISFKETYEILCRRFREESKHFTVLFNNYHNGVSILINTIKKRLDINEGMKEPVAVSNDYTIEDFNTEIPVEELDFQADNLTSQLFASETFTNTLNRFKDLYANFISAHKSLKQTQSIVDYLKTLRDHDNRTVVRPSETSIQAAIDENVDEAAKAMVGCKF